MPSGSTDLAEMLATLRVISRGEPYVYAVVGHDDPAIALADGVVREAEGTTVVIRRADADRAGLAYDFVAAWLTLSVHSSLEAVGLTAAVAAALGAEGVSCNVLAGGFHDHLLVPQRDEDRAIAILTRLRDDHARTAR